MRSSHPEIRTLQTVADKIAVRGSLVIPILRSLPAFLLIIAFLDAWFVGVSLPGGQAYISAFGERYPLPADVARVGFLALGAAMALFFFIINFTRALRLAASKSFIIARDGVNITVGAQKKHLALAALRGVRVSRLMIGTRIRLSHDTPPIIMSLGNAKRVVRMLDRFGVAVRTDASFPLRQEHPGLHAGETVIWEGRTGLWTLLRTYGWVAVLAVPLPVIYARWLWTAPGRTVGASLLFDRLFWTFAALMLGGFSVFGMVMLIVVHFNEWFREIAGTIAITNKRIIWREPRSGDVYRQINGGDVLSGALVETTARRGWIGLSYRDEDGEVREIDLKGLPRPADAIAAVEWLMQYSSGPDDALEPGH